jgi:hypothetical protein
VFDRVDGGVEEGFGCCFVAFHCEGFVAVILVPGLTAASSESASSSSAVGVLWLEQAVVLCSVDV